jgi:hypothetical protein
MTKKLPVCAFMILLALLSGFDIINPGKPLWIAKTAPDEKYYLAKDVYLTAGSAYSRKESFDHAMNDNVNLCFIPNNERNHYAAESTWYDPKGQEYRTIRQTYDLADEARKDYDRPKGGSTRVHSMTTKELADHKPGMWKVTLRIDNELVRRLEFFVR